MNPQKNSNFHHFNSNQFDKQFSTISQTQSSSIVSIKPLAIPCRYHPDQICQNYCIEQKCFQALCSQCIEEHLLHHKKNGLNDLYVKSFKSVRSECSSKLIKIIDKLYSKLTLINQPKNPQQMLENTDRQLQAIRLVMHQIIDQQLLKIREGIKQKVSQNFSIVKQLSQIHETLIKIITQLKEHNAIISEGIMDPPINVGDSIEKTLMLNQNALLEMFQKQSYKYDQKYRNINLEVSFTQTQFRQSILNNLKIGSTSNAPYIKINTSKISPENINDIGSRLRSRSKSPINERNFEQNSSKKGSLQTVTYPILHYFQTGENLIHLIDLKGEPQKSSIQLGNFKVPAFHASILSQKTGSVFISGGNLQISENPAKSSKMSKFSLLTNEFKKDFTQVKARSSHTLCQDFINDSIYIVGGYGQNSEQQNDISITIFESCLQRVNIKNGQVQELSPSQWGGACIAVIMNSFIIKACIQGIEIYDCIKNFWSQLSNLKGSNMDGIFCRGAGYSVLDTNTILIYGGYDENQQSSKQCYLMNIYINPQSPRDTPVEIQKTNTTLPIAEGFWNNPGILYQNNLWAIQNVEDDDGQPLEYERTLLKLDIEMRSWTTVKLTNKNHKP